jgi:hypothetical protein
MKNLKYVTDLGSEYCKPSKDYYCGKLYIYNDMVKVINVIYHLGKKKIPFNIEEEDDQFFSCYKFQIKFKSKRQYTAFQKIYS